MTPPLSANARQAATENALALIASTVEQIDGVLKLAGLPDPEPQNTPAPAGVASLAPDTVLAIEIQRLRDADYVRRHEDKIRTQATSSQTDTTQE